MSLWLLFKDELNGFYRSKIMLALWVGLPAMALLLYFLVDDIEGMPITVFTGLLVSSIGGLLTSVLIVVNILNEKEKKVYDLFLIRPIRRENLLLAKFGAVFLCVTVASFIAIVLAAVLDSANEGYNVQDILTSMKDSLIIALSIMAINLLGRSTYRRVLAKRADRGVARPVRLQSAVFAGSPPHDNRVG